LQISLGWKGLEDLDLHVECPGGELWHKERTACSGGGYVDTNHDVDATPPGYNAVENAQWQNPPRGPYKIKVNLYELKGQPPRDIPFNIIIKCGDKPLKTIPGHIAREKQTVDIAELDYPSCNTTP
jgi:hypothetical protein